MLPWNADAEIRAMIRSGAVAYELCRPVDLYGLWYARAIAWRTAPTMLRAVPMAIFASVVLPLIGLDEWRLGSAGILASAVGFVAAMFCALLLGLRDHDADQHQPDVDDRRRRNRDHDSRGWFRFCRA